MPKIFIFLICLLSIPTPRVEAQKFYLGNYLRPTDNEFELIGISSETGVATYKYKKEIYDTFFDREIGEIVVGIKNGIITTTIYNLIPKQTDVGLPKELFSKIQSAFPYPFMNVNGIYALNIDSEVISFGRVRNSLTLGKDRIIFMNSVKQSILKQ